MAAERRRIWGLIAAWHLTGVVAFMPFVNVKLDPEETNPFKGNKPEDPGLARIKAFIERRKWAAIAAFARGRNDHAK
jgi:hypothetical protein